MPSSALSLLLAILATTRLAGYAIRPLGQPAVVGEMLAGIALGPSLLGAVLPTLQQQLFPSDALLPLATLSQLGVILFMFVVGLRLDWSMLRRRIGSAVAISHSSIVAPFVLGARAMAAPQSRRTRCHAAAVHALPRHRDEHHRVPRPREDRHRARALPHARRLDGHRLRGGGRCYGVVPASGRCGGCARGFWHAAVRDDAARHRTVLAVDDHDRAGVC